MVFTFATSSEHNGGSLSYQSGKYPVKLYNSSCLLIHQEDNGGGNSDKKPSGGFLTSGVASSMSVTIANPITFYGNPVIDQSGQSGDLYNYYWTSYSRGTDGKSIYPFTNTPWHNLYLDSYIPLRHKSIYDPCPYGYRVPSNGTYNEFINTGWIQYSYVGGLTWKQYWIPASGWRTELAVFSHIGFYNWFRSSTALQSSMSYVISFSSDKNILFNRVDYSNATGLSIRCIEDCDLLPDQTHSSAGY